MTNLDLDGRVALVRRFFDTYYTQPRKESATEILSEERARRYGPLGLHLGIGGGEQPGHRLPEEAHRAATRLWASKSSTCPCSTS